MTTSENNISGPWARVMSALERLEKAGADASMRRTDAQAADAPVDPEIMAEVERLRDENESLKREALKLAGQVDRALEQLSLIEKG
ncbi:hypothetical protein [Minwuia sp.]|uniref:hypothetical protein n=1 Tax=Minwuia sp. TaxID=2493630 RepID=UPI003A8E7392